MQPGLESRQPWKPEGGGEEENFLFGLFTRADKWQRGASSSSILSSHKSRPTAHRGASRVFNAGVKPEGGAITRAYGKLCWLNGRPLRADWPKIWIAVGTVRHVECIWPLAEQDSFLGRSKEPSFTLEIPQAQRYIFKSHHLKREEKKVSLDAKNAKPVGLYTFCSCLDKT